MSNPYLRAALREQDALRPKATPVDYSKLKVAELTEEIARRNAGRDVPLPAEGKKSDLVAVLVEDDATQAPAPESAEEEADESADQSDTTSPEKE